MALQSMTALASITLQEASSSVSFSNIPQNYRDLVLVLSGTATTSADWFVRFNSSSSGYSGVFMFGNGSSASSGTTGTTEVSAGLLNTIVANATLQIMDYSATDKHKTTLIRQNNSTYTIAVASRWADTAAITTILAQMTSGNFTAGTTFDLYGRIG